MQSSAPGPAEALTATYLELVATSRTRDVLQRCGRKARVRKPAQEAARVTTQAVQLTATEKHVHPTLDQQLQQSPASASRQFPPEASPANDKHIIRQLDFKAFSELQQIPASSRRDLPLAETGGKHWRGIVGAV